MVGWLCVGMVVECALVALPPKIRSRQKKAVAINLVDS